MRRMAVVMLVTFGLALASGCTSRPTEPNPAKENIAKKRLGQVGEEAPKDKEPKKKKAGGVPFD